MSYTAVPDRRMPYDTDGTVVGLGVAVAGGGTPTGAFAGGIATYPTGTNLAHLQDYIDHGGESMGGGDNTCRALWFFFPGEQREITALHMDWSYATAGFVMQGSNDTTNGVDGTWETATLSGTYKANIVTLDSWRTNIGTVSFTGPKKVVRIGYGSVSGGTGYDVRLVHLYGAKAAGQTPDDVIWIDSDEGTSEFTAVEDFGDRPLGTSVVRQFKLKNVSATKSANLINIQCNDTDFSISTDNITYVVTISGITLAAGASTATLYVKNTTPSPGATLGPRFARITAIVTSWT